MILRLYLYLATKTYLGWDAFFRGSLRLGNRVPLLVVLLIGSSCVHTNDSPKTIRPDQPQLQPARDFSGLIATWPTMPQFHNVVDAATGGPACVVVYVEATHLPASNPNWPRLILAIWNDGRIVRSNDKAEGGAPYMGGTIAPNEVRALIERLTAYAVDAHLSPRTSYCGPSYPSTHIFFRTGDGHIYEIDSWHELQEAGGQRVFDGRYWVAVDASRSVDDILAGADDKYRSFRSLWVLLRQSADTVAPVSPYTITTPVFRFTMTRGLRGN